MIMCLAYKDTSVTYGPWGGYHKGSPNLGL